MQRKSQPVTSREYKVMLQAARFAGSTSEIVEAAGRLCDTFADAIEEQVVRRDDEVLLGEKLRPIEDEKQVTVTFLDTDDHRLRTSDLVFGQRQPLGGGPLELTLKFRHPDRFLASNSKTGGKKKFEEDIKVTTAHKFISLHSLSGKIKNVDEGSDFKKLKDIKKLFDPLPKQLADAYEPAAKLRKVGNLTARQTVLKGPTFGISQNTEAECALIVWHREGVKEPLVVEFSYRYTDENLGPDTEPFTANESRRGYKILQVFRESNTLAEWADLEGPTKTAYVYSLEDK